MTDVGNGCLSLAVAGTALSQADPFTLRCFVNIVLNYITIEAMAKTTGGVRNYRRTSFAYQKRRQEYLMLLAGGDYNADKSKFYSSGGFVVTHNEHNSDNRGKNGKIVDKSQSTAKALARKGYRVYLDSEKSISFGDSKRDG